MFAASHPDGLQLRMRTIKPAHAFAIHQPAFASQQHPDPQIAEPRPCVSQIADARPQGRLILGATLLIPGGSSNLGQPTGLRTAHRESAPKPVGQLSAMGGPQTFFRRASDSMCLSSERSATSRFNRLFSSSSGRSRRSSLTPTWAYFFFQA